MVLLYKNININQKMLAREIIEKERTFKSFSWSLSIDSVAVPALTSV